ncbi:MAG: hypothetical protein U5K84_06465 [Alkalibacterium sp.]|nr:hypothetical protein [Alkalibacterium sp.]
MGIPVVGTDVWRDPRGDRLQRKPRPARCRPAGKYGQAQLVELLNTEEKLSRYRGRRAGDF